MPRAEQGRSLRTVVFLDTVESTRVAAELGDERWQVLLRRELAILRHLLKDRGGREVDAAGDGLFVLFREPARAVYFAADAALAVRELGLEIRAGVHFGECEFAEGHPGGIVVHTGARTMSTGGAGEVIVTQTVRDLVSGGSLRFAEHGVHELKGVPGTWPLFMLTGIDDVILAPPLPEEEAATRRREAASRPPVVRRRTFLLGIVAALVAGSLATYLITRREEDKLPRPPSGINRLVRFDPTTGAMTMKPYILPPAGEVAGLAVGEGGVWTADIAVSHMDPTDGTLEGTLEGIQQQGQTGAMVVTTGLDDVWVASSTSLFRIDPADDEVLDVRFTDVGVGQTPATSIAVGRDAVWVAMANGTLFRISPIPGLPIEETISLGGLPSDIVIANGGVWIADEFGDLIRVDERTGRETDRLKIGGTLRALAATEDGLWVVDSEGLVVLVSLDTREVRQSIPIGGRPVDVAVGSGVVWIVDQRGEQLLTIDEMSLEPGESGVALPGPPAAIAIDEDRGVIWVRTAGIRISG
ncbi:MAG TPA: adenylate/guanylate cyclase domain-containing protein [Actinomycetota bacterium]|nr:adenylate/guanylate cyclase domain-containing protein [Actinomycetota bacterium]